MNIATTCIHGIDSQDPYDSQAGRLPCEVSSDHGQSRCCDVGLTASVRIEVGKYNAGTRGEVRFFFEKDDQTRQFYYVQAGPKGERRLLLNTAVDQPFYRQAVEAAQTRLSDQAASKSLTS